jgi:retron-type reverse transcriptase
VDRAIRRGKYGKHTRRLEPTRERQASTANRLRTSRLIFPTTSTSSGIGCRGSYHPPPVRRVDVPKGDGRGGTRPLGIPAVADRIAQAVVKRQLEPLVEPCFHEDSYGYRPGKSALDAVGVARQRC